ncbi:CHAT domain-containing protein [Stenomitos frigidus ULC18]|uniref:CHAT domain-containing protein n=2 Tax=Stenomitos TaxID=1844270 RepID=A0A2T1EBH1_9CYAN|nr:CHAT domain-containing protein [Stenomitos frigidus ULC18]
MAASALTTLVQEMTVVQGTTIAQGTPLQVSPDRPTPEVPVAKPLSVLKLDLKKLQETLDRNDIAGAIQDVEVSWKQQYENYYQGKFTTRLLSADQIGYSLNRVAQLTGKKAALIYVIPTPEHLELLLVPPDGQLSHRRVTAATRTRLTETVKAFRSGVVNAGSQPSDYLPAAQQLYQWIISPLEATLKAQQIDTLIFCLGGGLRGVPIAAFHDGQHFLIERYSFATIPAFSLLDQHPSRLAGTKVLAMGASQFQNESPLPAVPVELTTISQLWQGESWLNQDFTLAKLKDRRSASSFGLIHLATHAILAPGTAEASYIQFWDQPIRLNRLRDLGLNFPVVQLLVLSACQTALGDPNAELGFAGLAVQSGAKAALASLWSVSDAGTLVLMVNFYQRLKAAPIKAEALRQTQLAMLRGQTRLQKSAAKGGIAQRAVASELLAAANADLSHPYYWASFTIIGNPW